MSTTVQPVPWPAGATEVDDDWADVGTPDQFRLFYGPEWRVNDGTVQIFGTQLADGTVEHRCIKAMSHWDDEYDAAAARRFSQSFAEAADALVRLNAADKLTNGEGNQR
jgi:hypothetical protein